MAPKYIRGLVNFITELRSLKGEDEKLLRVKEEIAKVRIVLSAAKVDSYSKCKCILKLLYIEMMGYDVDLGYLQSVELISSSSYADKAVGYMGCEVLLHGHTDLLRLCINTTLEDMRGNEGVASLALNFVANTHSEEILERIGREVLGMLSLESPHVRKKLYMCLYRLHDMETGYGDEEWREIIGGIIEREQNVVCTMAVCSLASKVFGKSSNSYCSYLVALLWDRMNEGASAEYDYFTVSSPWLIIKVLGILSVMDARGDER
ncbi:adaptin, alpha, putative [Theileria equi strain WA]|uniref:Adaptin, alpha, putative n=1 Tax=Theileria equi strain WA TaxID=1537102 RepID=L1LAT0_THEEQ|nr:adaptin, alpha, putative [Theileria equi strain WA]EKX72364.1 adaptin, alpha, putative [Theileria equi strain WA]|eukprot:XP_004831816.1 adaptin, alpha, putative [Theileria equi strain WA]